MKFSAHLAAKLMKVVMSPLAGSEGAGIFVNGSSTTCANSNTCQVNITPCTFHNNSASDYGGGASISGDGLAVNISQSTFYNNTASKYGGGACLFGDGLAVMVSDSQFMQNEGGSSSPTGVVEGGGGALDVSSSLLPGSSKSSLLVTATNFTANSGAVKGGALYTQVPDVSVKGCGFNNNTRLSAYNNTRLSAYNIVGSAMYVDKVMAFFMDTSNVWNNSGLLVWTGYPNSVHALALIPSAPPSNSNLHCYFCCVLL